MHICLKIYQGDFQAFLSYSFVVVQFVINNPLFAAAVELAANISINSPPNSFSVCIKFLSALIQWQVFSFFVLCLSRPTSKLGCFGVAELNLRNYAPLLLIKTDVQKLYFLAVASSPSHNFWAL
jgi:hypothetical protein